MANQREDYVAYLRALEQFRLAAGGAAVPPAVMNELTDRLKALMACPTCGPRG